MDRLLSGLLKSAEVTDSNLGHKRSIGHTVTAIVNAIASCYVHGFRVWLERTDQGNLNWMNLDSPAKKRPLEKLPDPFAKFMPAEVEARVKPTWKAFRDAYERISAPNAQPDDHAEVFHLCQEFVRKFTSLGDLSEAYFKARAAPYICTCTSLYTMCLE